MLNNKEINKLIDKEYSKNVSVSDLLTASTLKILQNEENIYFIIKYPIISQICNKLVVRPVIHNNKTIMLEAGIVAECSSEYHQLSDCKETTSKAICRITNTSNTCLLNMLSRQPTTCKSIPADHIAPLEEIDDGLVVINDQTVEVREDSFPQIKIKGTFLVSFKDSANINNINYTNWRKAVRSYPRAAPAQILNITELVPLLSLPYLHHANLKNLEHIAALQEITHIQSKQFSTALLILIFIAVVSIVMVTIYKCHQHRKNADLVKES